MRFRTPTGAEDPSSTTPSSSSNINGRPRSQSASRAAHRARSNPRGSHTSSASNHASRTNSTPQYSSPHTSHSPRDHDMSSENSTRPPPSSSHQSHGTSQPTSKPSPRTNGTTRTASFRSPPDGSSSASPAQQRRKSSAPAPSSTPNYSQPTLSSVRRGMGVGAPSPNTSPTHRPEEVSSSTDGRRRRDSHRSTYSNGVGGASTRRRPASSQNVSQSSSRLIQCPLCSRSFAKSVIEMHAAGCEGRSPDPMDNGEMHPNGGVNTSMGSGLEVNLPPEKKADFKPTPSPPNSASGSFRSPLSSSMSRKTSVPLSGSRMPPPSPPLSSVGLTRSASARTSTTVECPICNQTYPKTVIEEHAAQCGEEVFV